MGKLFNDRELDFFDSINAELIALAGERINYYSQNRNCSKMDPLYGEFTERNFDGPYEMEALFRWPPMTTTSSEQGLGFEWQCEVVMSRSLVEKAHAPYPQEGDIVEVWRTPFHDANSRGKGMFFDIIQVQSDGQVFDSPSFTQFKCTLKRRSEFAAERKITPP